MSCMVLDIGCGRSILLHMNAIDVVIKSPQQQRIEAQMGKSIDDLLQGLVDLGCTQDEIARRFGVGQPTVSRWMKAHGVRRSK